MSANFIASNADGWTWFADTETRAVTEFVVNCPENESSDQVRVYKLVAVYDKKTDWVKRVKR